MPRATGARPGTRGFRHSGRTYTSALVDIRLAALRDTITRLIAGASVNIAPVSPVGASSPIYSVSKNGVSFALISGKPDFVFVLSLHGVGQWRVRITRPAPPFTKIEERVFGRLPKTLLKTFASGGDHGSDAPSQLGALLALDHLLVAQVLRRDVVGGYWTHLVIMQALIDLTFSRYEGSRATSGVVYTSQPEMFLQSLPSTGYTFGAFEHQHLFDREFFATPASYRYVDGKNAFYLVDNRRQVWGVLRAEAPEQHNLIDRCAGLHVARLVSHMPGRSWCGFIGLNDDVQVRTAQGLSLSWRANHWQVRDDTVLSALFVQSGALPDVADLLSRTLQAMAELRKGALLLIPKDDAALPSTVGQIDTSVLASLLNAQLEQTTFAAIHKANAAIQVLSSDGITIVTPTGKLLACGRIIDLTGVSGGTGGGRTQAATAASHFGLAVKVSADGPISAFRDGKRILAL